MMRSVVPAVLSAAVLAGPARADAPLVAVDIAPLHGLVSQVMEGVGTPSLVIAPGASPHGYQMRPSEARALQNADLVFWIGEGLTPWLHDALETLAEGAEVTEMLDAPGTVLLETRETAVFEMGEADHDDQGDDHGHDDHDKHEEDDHADHDDHGHDEDHAADDHGHDEDHAAQDDHDDHGHDDHDHGAYDPHAWLSPDNAVVWLGVIAERLSAFDPSNAGTYAANASAAQAALEDLHGEVRELLATKADRAAIVFHDAYQYAEAAFGLRVAGAIAVSDASDPSPARISALRDLVAERGVTCILAEPQFDAGIVAAVAEGAVVNSGVIDPLGADIAPGPEHYGATLRQMARVLDSCL